MTPTSWANTRRRSCENCGELVWGDADLCTTCGLFRANRAVIPKVVEDGFAKPPSKQERRNG